MSPRADRYAERSETGRLFQNGTDRGRRHCPGSLPFDLNTWAVACAASRYKTRLWFFGGRIDSYVAVQRAYACNDDKVTINLDRVHYMEWVGTSTKVHFGTKHSISVKESPAETRDLLNTLDEISKRGAGFKSLADTWADTTTPHGRLMLTVLGGLAEFERELIKSRTGEGRARAKAAGVHMGRPSKLSPHQQREAIARRDAGEALTDIARTFGVSHTTIGRLTAAPS